MNAISEPILQPTGSVNVLRDIRDLWAPFLCTCGKLLSAQALSLLCADLLNHSSSVSRRTFSLQQAVPTYTTKKKRVGDFRIQQTGISYAYLWDPKILSPLFLRAMSRPNTSPERSAEMRSSKSFSFSLLSPADAFWTGLLLLLLRVVRSRARLSRSISRRCGVKIIYSMVDTVITCIECCSNMHLKWVILAGTYEVCDSVTG